MLRRDGTLLPTFDRQGNFKGVWDGFNRQSLVQDEDDYVDKEQRFFKKECRK